MGVWGCGGEGCGCGGRGGEEAFWGDVCVEGRCVCVERRHVCGEGSVCGEEVCAYERVYGSMVSVHVCRDGYEQCVSMFVKQ